MRLFKTTLILILFHSFIGFGQNNAVLKEMKLVLLKSSPFNASNHNLDQLYNSFFVACKLGIVNEQDSLLLLMDKNPPITSIDSAIYAYNIGVYWAIQSNYIKAQLYQNQAGIIFDRENRLKEELYVKQQMANLHYFMKEVPIAFKHYQEILHDPNSDIFLKGAMHHNLAALLMELDTNYLGIDPIKRKKSIDSIEYHLDKSIEIHNAVHYPKGVAATYSIYINMKIHQGQFNIAQVMIDSCQKISMLSENYGRIAFLQIKKAMLLDTLGFYDAAIDTAYKAVNYYEKTGNFDQMGHAMSAVYRAMYAKGDYKSAAETAIWMKNNIRDNLDKKLTDGLSKYRAEYETDKKNLEIIEKNALLESERLKTSNKNRLLLALAFGLISLVAIFMFIIQRNRRKAQKEKDHLLLKSKEEGLSAVIQAQEEERKRIAEDLHDGIVQQLGGLKMGLQKAFLGLNIESSDKMLQLLEDSTNDLRELSHKMMPRSLSELGLIPALEDMFELSLGNTQINYHFEQFEITDRFAKNIEIVIYRIGQELVNNVLKHSGANQVNIQLFKTGNTVVFIVEDNGKGMEKTQESNGIGLLNITSRLDTINGEVNYAPSPESGTLVTVKIPL